MRLTALRLQLWDMFGSCGSRFALGLLLAARFWPYVQMEISGETPTTSYIYQSGVLPLGVIGASMLVIGALLAATSLRPQRLSLGGRLVAAIAFAFSVLLCVMWYQSGALTAVYGYAIYAIFFLAQTIYTPTNGD